MNTNPIDLFQEWFDDAKCYEHKNPNAASLATASLDGKPTVRMILVKSIDEHGFIFFTNKESRKGQELAVNPHAALCFYWKSTARQVRVEGIVEEVSEEESDKYFFSRTRESQVGAWASKQSCRMKGKVELEERMARYMKKYEASEIPRPKFWLGYCLKPDLIEFWTEGQFRLHDRRVYYAEGETWRMEHLFP